MRSPKKCHPPPEGPKLNSKWCTHPKSHFTRNKYQMCPKKCVRTTVQKFHLVLLELSKSETTHFGYKTTINVPSDCNDALMHPWRSHHPKESSVLEKVSGEMVCMDVLCHPHINHTLHLIHPYTCVCPHWYSPSCSRWFWISAGRQMSSSRCRHGTYGGPPKVHKTVKITLWAFLKC